MTTQIANPFSTIAPSAQTFALEVAQTFSSPEAQRWYQLQAIRAFNTFLSACVATFEFGEYCGQLWNRHAITKIEGQEQLMLTAAEEVFEAPADPWKTSEVPVTLTVLTYDIPAVHMPKLLSAAKLPNKAFHEMTKSQLLAKAKEYGLKVSQKISKQQLIAKLATV